MIGDDFLKYTINMSELCNIKKIKATYLNLLVKYGITHPSNAERYEGFLFQRRWTRQHQLLRET